jgi:hypothetical protein
VPRVSGDLEKGILQRVLTLVGSGAKAIQYFTFGPEYVFPGNTYSEKAFLLPRLAEAHQWIGRGEDLLWPGRRPSAEVAIVHPRSAQLWDALDIKEGLRLIDATNTNLNGYTVDYMAEVFDLYLALQHANIPVDILDEDDLASPQLADYKVLYLTSPNLPLPSLNGIIKWTKAVGVCFNVAGAASRDQYDNTPDTFSKATGVKEEGYARSPILHLETLLETNHGTGDLGDFTAYGGQSKISASGSTIRARFADGTPAVVEEKMGQGKLIKFAWFPGISYRKSAKDDKKYFPKNFSVSIGKWITSPVKEAKVKLPVEVDHAMVETPLLHSSKGDAITLLNWSGEKISSLHLRVQTALKIKTIESMQHGKIPFKSERDWLSLSIPLDEADLLLLRP